MLLWSDLAELVDEQILVTMVTTFMVSLVAMLVWRFNPFLVVLPVFLIFGKRCLIV